MTDTLFNEKQLSKGIAPIGLGSGLTIKVNKAFPPKADLYRHNVLIKHVDLSDKVAVRLFVVETVELGSEILALADALGISRQTVYNYLDIQTCYGREGLIHGYSSKNSSLRKERKKHGLARDLGNKAKAIAKQRRLLKKGQEQKEAERQPQLNFSFGDSSFDSQSDLNTNADVKEVNKSLEVSNELNPSLAEATSGACTPIESSEDGVKEVSDLADGDERLECSDAQEFDSSGISIRPGRDLFSEPYDWQGTRYAGMFCYLICLQSVWNWLGLVLERFGKGYRIFLVFLLMVGRNIRSIEHLKHIRLREAGLVSGLGKLRSRTTIWQWFYDAARQRCSARLLVDYFCFQIRTGLVSVYAWFTDGHLLPYTGKEKVHQAYNTQRQKPEPGQTNLVTCDMSGRIVDFEIEEGKGKLRCRIFSLFRKWWRKVSASPVMVFDREGYGGEFFLGLINQKIPFVTWEKHTNKSKLSTIADEKFSEAFTHCGKEYRVFEGEKSFSVEIGNCDKKETKTFVTRRIYIWNLATNSRTCGLAWSGENTLSTKDGARLILSRWGASENTFKHLQERHPLHYHPGFSLSKSEHQEIVNPEIKEKEKLIQQTRKALAKCYKTLSKTQNRTNKDGTPRKNNKHQRLKEQIANYEKHIEQLTKAKQALPDKINVESLADYRSFKKIDNEGKNLFDFVTTSVWNARKEMVDWLRPCFNRDSEVVDLFYAITECQGWIKSTPTDVIVRLEPLQQTRRRDAQNQFCRKLSARSVQLPNGKWLSIEVGNNPTRS